MKHHNFLMVIEGPRTKINVNVTFKSKRPTLEEICGVVEKFKGNSLCQLIYIGKTDTEICSLVPYKYAKPTVTYDGDIFEVVTVSHNKCSGCHFSGKSCDYFRRSINVECRNKIFIKL